MQMLTSVTAVITKLIQKVNILDIPLTNTFGLRSLKQMKPVWWSHISSFDLCSGVQSPAVRSEGFQTVHTAFKCSEDLNLLKYSAGWLQGCCKDFWSLQMVEERVPRLSIYMLLNVLILYFLWDVPYAGTSDSLITNQFLQ